jgi:hypothetical protein
MPTVIKQYESISQMRASALGNDYYEIPQNLTPLTKDKWTGGESINQTYYFAQYGNKSLVPEAEKLISKIETQISIPRKLWTRNVAGSFCAVPDHLAGRPTAMRRLIHESSEHTPINIYVRPNSSANITAEQLQKRGIAILALVMALARLRPINLNYCFLGDSKNDAFHTCLIARIETAPLNLAQACYVLTSAGFYRTLSFSLAHQVNGFRGNRVRTFEETEEIIYHNLGKDPKQTLIIGPVHHNDPIINTSIIWINEQIHRFIRINEND